MLTPSRFGRKLDYAARRRRLIIRITARLRSADLSIDSPRTNDRLAVLMRMTRGEAVDRVVVRSSFCDDAVSNSYGVSRQP